MNMLTIKLIEFIWLMLPAYVTAYVIYKVYMFVLDAIDILQERHKTLSYTLPYLSYDNRLICLHKGPDSRGRLNVPEGNQLPTGQSPGVCDCPPVSTA